MAWAPPAGREAEADPAGETKRDRLPLLMSKLTFTAQEVIAALRRHGMADDDGGEVGCIVGQGGGRQPNHGNGGNTCNSHRNLHRTKGWDVVGHT